MIKAWHFVGPTLRNGHPVPPDGVWLEYDGPLPIIMCERGLHASVDPFDALQYAPGNTLCRVTLDGDILADTDKHVATRRLIHTRRDMKSTLRAFSRRCALDVIHLWDAPLIVKEYLETGDESKQYPAGAAAWYAAWYAAWAAAGAAARAAARAAAWYAARAAAGAAAWEKYRGWFHEIVAREFSGVE